MKRPLASANFPDLEINPHPWAGLVTSLKEEHDYECKIEGEVPKDMQGTLYRLGPGLYDRGPDRKRMVLDGDGMIQEFQFSKGKVNYRNRFIHTKKYLSEEKAGRFTHPTLSTHSSGSRLENIGIHLPHQANITPLFWNNRLLAFDESQKPYELDAKTLNTLGETELDGLQPKLRYWAHWKLDPDQKLVHYMAVDQGPVLTAHIVSMNLESQVIERHHLKLPRASYFHDWFFTKEYFGFVLHPAIVSLKTLLRVGLGFDTFSDALKWKPKLGNLVFLYHRNTKKTFTFKAPACWMWHSVNAYESQSEVILDFIGSEEGGGLGDSESPLFKIMKNEEMEMPENPTNNLRRYRMKPKSGKLVYETLNAQGNFELPTVSANTRGKKHTHSHFIHAKPKEFFARGLSEWSQDKEELSSFLSDGHEYFSEPLAHDCIFSKPSKWLSSLVYDGEKKLSYLGIFEIGHLSKGPVAKVWLKHHSPLGFHGYWKSGL